MGTQTKKEEDRARSKRWYYEHRDEQLKRRKSARETALQLNPNGERAKRNAQTKRWREVNPDRNRKLRKQTRIRYEFGISVEQYEEFIAWFNGRCACCGTTEPGAVKGWALDHDHQRHILRGALNQHCNKVLGALGDNATEVARVCARFLVYLAQSGDHPDEDVATALIALLRK